MSISWMSELESSAISFAASDSTSAMFVIPVVNFQLDREGIKKKGRWQEGLGGGGRDYSTEVIILNISVKGGLLFEGGD